MWGETTASLGFYCQPFGFEHESVRNVDLVTHHGLGVAVMVTAGDMATGLESYTPQVRYERKEVTAQIISGGLDRLFDNGRPDWQVWLLLHHMDRGEQIVPAELSRAAGVSRDGLVTDWLERIIIPEDDGGPGRRLPISLDANPVVPDFDISRRIS